MDYDLDSVQDNISSLLDEPDCMAVGISGILSRCKVLVFAILLSKLCLEN